MTTDTPASEARLGRYLTTGAFNDTVSRCGPR